MERLEENIVLKLINYKTARWVGDDYERVGTICTLILYIMYLKNGFVQVCIIYIDTHI